MSDDGGSRFVTVDQLFKLLEPIGIVMVANATATSALMIGDNQRAAEMVSQMDASLQEMISIMKNMVDYDERHPS